MRFDGISGWAKLVTFYSRYAVSKLVSVLKNPGLALVSLRSGEYFLTTKIVCGT